MTTAREAWEKEYPGYARCMRHRDIFGRGSDESRFAAARLKEWDTAWNASRAALIKEIRDSGPEAFRQEWSVLHYEPIIEIDWRRDPTADKNLPLYTIPEE